MRAITWPKTNKVCPICDRGYLVEVGQELWDCERRRCNNRFFYDTEGDVRTLNVRDKPFIRRHRTMEHPSMKLKPCPQGEVK